MLVNFDALCRDISAMGPSSTHNTVYEYARAQRTFLEAVSDIICFHYKETPFSLTDVLAYIKQEFANSSPQDMMLVSRCVRLMADKESSRSLYRAHKVLFSKYYDREAGRKYVTC